MELTDSQLRDLFDAYWQGQPCRCPSCASTLDARHSNVLGGYVLRLTCPKGCAFGELDSDRDPRRGEFRDWTPHETDRLIADFAANRSPRCPVCDVPITGQSKWVFSGKLVEIRCERCRQRREESLAR